ncbi:serine hydrolase domain-containing protein [Nitratireductor kimnyeongensis]|uniref:Serine hydrolase domain-containing protein n=1 Tax=Nitratireductor kimnyeongensis TaxID=430679 RepID=A0ABW0T7R6_9HYPH|nr:serine hydrolase domain-containing protein [Nitratireductor kimnyeongensis]
MPTPTPTEAALKALDHSMSARVKAGEIAGATWLVHHGERIHVSSAGTFEMNDAGAAMARDTIFRVASITKPVTGVLAMMLVEEGLLTLDGPVDGLLPELANRRVLKRIDGPLDDTVPANGPVTLRQLLTMTFGLGAIMVFPEACPIQLAMREAGIAPSWILPKMSSDTYMQKLGELPHAAHPGEKFLYNNGLDVAGILIERATGERLGALMKARLFEPLGMTDTDFFVPPEKQHRLPPLHGPDFTNGTMDIKAYGPEDGIDFSAPPPLDSGAAGLATTVDDYLAFSRMMMNGGELDGRRYLEPETIEEMTRDQLTPQQKTGPHADMFMEDGGAGWGLGVSVGLKKTRPWLTPGSFGWNGGYGTTAYTDPANGIIGIYFSQQMMTSPEPPATYMDFWTQVYSGA